MIGRRVPAGKILASGRTWASRSDPVTTDLLQDFEHEHLRVRQVAEKSKCSVKQLELGRLMTSIRVGASSMSGPR
jgi:hypothetical protein